MEQAASAEANTYFEIEILDTGAAGENNFFFEILMFCVTSYFTYHAWYPMLILIKLCFH